MYQQIYTKSSHLEVACEVMDALCVEESADNVGRLQAGECLEVLGHGCVVLALVVQMVTPSKRVDKGIQNMYCPC